MLTNGLLIKKNKEDTFEKQDAKANETSKKADINFKGANAAKYMIGATALAAVIGLGIAYKGKLCKGIQELLGGAEKAAEKGAKRTEEAATDALTGGVKKAEDVITDSEKLPKKSSQRTATGSLTDEFLPNKGAYGQDLYDPINPMNAMEPMSPYYENPMNRGLYGQDLYNPTDPMNAMDSISPYYQDPLPNSWDRGLDF